MVSSRTGARCVSGLATTSFSRSTSDRT
jgi:hypothetical protein